ncbi:hypothetical protein [Neptuniibacter sp. QD37_11]|uniref:hypothetical protein n=1 Tax=Neptuniibacter sp. QD37_11 TaxID=3398209 RepID=UPI0039F5ED9B
MSAADSYDNEPHAVARHVIDYKRGIATCEEKIARHLLGQANIRAELLDRETTFNARNFLMKILMGIPFLIRTNTLNEGLQAHSNEIQREEQRKVEHYKQVVLNVGRYCMLRDPEVEDAIGGYESEHRKLLDLYHSILSVYNAGKEARSALETAKSSLSSAQTMEVLDMATSNKGISMMSTMSNSSASSDVKSASELMSKFNKEAVEHARVAAHFTETFSTELIDLTMDFAFGGIMDFVGSVFALSALSSASSDVEKAIKSLNPVLLTIESHLREVKDSKDIHEASMLHFKNQHRLKAIPILARHDIEVDEAYINKLTALYPA